MRNWITPTPVEEAARAALQEAGENRRQRALGWLLPLPSALLLALAALSICREAWALHWLYTPLMAAFVLLLAQVVRTVGDAPLWLLALGAVGVRVMFALGWTVYPHGDALTGWNLALELAAVPLGTLSGGPGHLPGLRRRPQRGPFRFRPSDLGAAIAKGPGVSPGPLVFVCGCQSLGRLER